MCAGGGPMSGHDLRRAEINRRRAAARARIAGNGHVSTAGRVADQCRRAIGRARCSAAPISINRILLYTTDGQIAAATYRWIGPVARRLMG